jgi:hypothetical protein
VSNGGEKHHRVRLVGSGEFTLRKEKGAIVVTVVTVISIISTAVVAFATVALALITNKYVRLTKVMVEEMKNAREPNVHVDFELPEKTLRLVIGNSGQSSAKNVRFEVVSDVDCIRTVVNQKNVLGGLANLHIFENGISYLSPGRKLKFWAGFLEPKKETHFNKVFRVLVRYENDSGKLFERNIAIDMGQYEDVLFESFKDSNLTVAEAIKDAERSRQLRDPGRSIFKARCPTCGENVKLFAKKCPHCGEWIKQKESHLYTTKAGESAGTSSPPVS